MSDKELIPFEEENTDLPSIIAREEARFNRKLTQKQIKWLVAFLEHGNASKAAREAGYSSVSFASHSNKTNPVIGAIIDRKMTSLAMTVEETLAKLSDYARFDLGDYLKVTRDEEGEEGDPKLDLEGLLRDGWGFMVKVIRPTRYGTVVEFHDPFLALRHIDDRQREHVLKLEGNVKHSLAGPFSVEELTDDELDAALLGEVIEGEFEEGATGEPE